MKALIVVDMQNDFIDGPLAVPGAAEIIVPIQNKLRDVAEARGIVVFTADAHPENHCSFIENGGKWPKHCVEDTRGFELQCGILGMLYAMDWRAFDKGCDATREEYSGFDNPGLHRYLKARGVTDVEICGLARDYCVAATAQDAIRLGYRVAILEDLCRSVGK